MKSYHFSLGNSSAGPVGFCARIRATSKKKALELLYEVLPTDVGVDPYDNGGVEYIRVYFNDDAITVKDIDEWEWVEKDDYDN
jgi:hypothetical protein